MNQGPQNGQDSVEQDQNFTSPRESYKEFIRNIRDNKTSGLSVNVWKVLSQ